MLLHAVPGRRPADKQMPLKESEAVVLRSFPLGEADRLVSFFCREAGRLRGVAKGARRPKGRFGSTLEILTHVRVWYFEKETRDLVRVNQCELLESFLEVQQDYERGLALAMVSEVTEHVLPEREPSDPAFRLVLHTARAIKQGTSAGLALAYFALWTVRLGGWLPDLARCARCGKDILAKGGFGSDLYTGLACSHCRMPGMRTIAGCSLTAAQQMLEKRLNEIAATRPEPAAPTDLNEYLLDVIEHQIERKLQTRRMLDLARQG